MLAPGPSTTRCWRCGALLATDAPALACARCGTADPPPPREPRLLRWPGVLHGLEGALRGAAFVGEHPRLWTWIVVPLLVNAAIFGGLIVVALQVGQSLLPDLSATDWGWFDGLRVVVAPTLSVIMTIVAVLASLITALLLAGIVNAPFYDLLSEQVEIVALGRRDPGRPWSAFLADSLAALRAACVLVVRQAAIMSLLFLLSFTVVGAALFVLAGFFYTGFALVDVTLARKLYPAPSRRAWARKHWMQLVGLGLPVSLIPPLQPFGIVGATLLYLRAHDKG